MTATRSYDEMKLLFRCDYKVNDFITVHQPTLGEIIDYGSSEYYAMIHNLCAIPSDMKSTLWDMGIDWNKMPDFHLFMMLSKTMKQKKTSIILGDIDLSAFMTAQEEDNIILYNSETDQKITEDDYNNLVGYLRIMHNITPKREKAKNKFTRDILIQEEKDNREANKNKVSKPFLKNLVSGMLIFPGFKYTSATLKECGIYEFMDSVRRAQAYTSTLALLNGKYCGMMDMKNIKKDEFNWLRDID